MTNTKLNQPELSSGQKAALVIRLYYEEERLKAKLTQGTRTDILPNSAKSKMTADTSKELAKKAGIGKSSMAYLLAVYRSRPDLFDRVFNGEYSINKAHTQMKADEAPSECSSVV